MDLLTNEDKAILREAIDKGPLTYDVVDKVKAAHNGCYPQDFHTFVNNLQPSAFAIEIAGVDEKKGSAKQKSPSN